MKSNLQSKGRGTRRQGYVTGVPSLSRSTSSFGEGVEHNAHMKANEGHPILLTLLPMQDAVIHCAVALKVATKPLQYKVGEISTTQLEAPNKPRSFTTMECGSEVTSSV